MQNETSRQALEKMLKVSQAKVVAPEESERLHGASVDFDEVEKGLAKQSEDAYRDVADKIVSQSIEQLGEQNESKNDLKKLFTIFFTIFISVQFLIMVGLLVCVGFFEMALSDTVLISYITSVFVETIGAIIIMIRYAFDSQQEVNILQILNGVIENYQKFKK